MSNGTFTAGTWNKLPSNCTRDYILTYLRCSEYGTIVLTECLQWVANAVTTCVAWASSTTTSCLNWVSVTSTQCCTWWPCSWLCQIVLVIVTLVCLAWQVIVTWVCLLFALVVTLICLVVALIVYVFCILWSLIEIILCLSSANGGTAFLLTDGTVMVQECKSAFGATWPTHRWWKLTPDNAGTYINGTWSRLADSVLARKYFGSSVLADGRVVVCGGEYSDASGTIQQDEINTCEIYDPVADSWTAFATPKSATGVTWATIGDVPSTVLPDGTFLIASNSDGKVAKLDPSTLTWTAMANGPGPFDEVSWVLMPDGTIVMPLCNAAPATTVYDITTDTWTPGNSLPVATSLVDVGQEIGPGLLLYDGTAFFFGATQHTGIFTPGAGPAWTNGPDLPTLAGSNLGIVDGPAALMVDGRVLFGAGPIDAKGSYTGPTSYFEMSGGTYNRTSDPGDNGGPTYMSRLLLLPNGDVFVCREDSSSFFSYNQPAAVPQNSFRPVIRTCPASANPGATIQVSGLQFNGLSQAVAYGDDSQSPTNYPLVRIVNQRSHHVRYCRTLNHTTVDAAGNTVPSMGVATGAALITTNVQIPADIETGGSTLFVVANGIPSAPHEIVIGLT